MSANKVDGATVMIVDDYDDTRAMMRAMLEMKGCLVLEAVNGLEAVKIAIRECTDIDLILMDLKMPVLDGYEATRRILAQNATCHIPIVAMSAHCDGNWRDEALAAGARECVSKPIDFALLDKVMNRFVGQDH